MVRTVIKFIIMTNFIKSKAVKAVLGLLAAVALFVAVQAQASYTFTQNYHLGMSGAEVQQVQMFLNNHGFVVSTTGAGSPGSESTYYGSKTAAAVASFQAANGINAGAYAGYWGPSTRAVANAMGDTMMSSTLPAGCTNTTGYSPTTGVKCDSVTSGNTTTTTYPTGCTSAVGYSPITGLSCSGTTTTNNNNMGGSGAVVASLAADNPASGYLVAGQATADLAHFTFSGSGTVKTVTLQRIGISNNSSLTNVYLYDGATRLTDSASVNTAGVITFTNVNLAVNGSKTISVKADIYSLANGQTVGVALTSFTTDGATSATVANLTGNIMSISDGSGILAGVVLCQGGCASTGTVTVNAGLTQYILWTNPVQVSTHSVLLRSDAFHFIGSAPTDALANIGLFVDGTKVATSSGVNSLGYIVFDLMNAPVTLATGSHTIDVRADIIKGSARTIQLTLQNAGDFMVSDSQLGVNIAANVTNSSTAFSSISGNTISVNAGSVTVNVDPSFTAMTNVTGGSANATIGKFILTAYGEDVKVNTLRVTPSFSTAPTASTACTNGLDCSLSNVTLYFNGSQIGTSQSWPGVTYLDFSLGSSLIVPAGQDSTLEVKADLMTTGGATYSAGVVVVTLPTATNNGQGMASLDSTIDVPASSVATTGLTIQTGIIGVAKNSALTSQTANPNTQNAKIGSYIIQNQSSSEAIRVTNLGIAITYNTITSTNLSNLKTSETSGSGSTPINPTSTVGGVNNFSVEFTLAPGATKTIDVFANLGTATSGSVQTTLQLTALGASSNTTLCAPSGLTGSVDGCNNGTTALTGQLMTLGSGSLATPTAVTSTSTKSQFIATGTTSGVTDAAMATFNFTASSGTATISELKFVDVGDGSPALSTNGNNAITNVKVGSITAPVVSNIAYLTGLNIAVPNGGGGTNVNAYASYAPVGATGLTSGTLSNLRVCYIRYTVGGTTTTSGSTDCGGAGTGILGTAVSSAQTMNLVASKPTITLAASGSTLITGTVEVADITVTANAKGDITLTDLPLVFTRSGTDVVLTADADSGSDGTVNDIVVKDSSNNTVSTTNTALSSTTAGGTTTITFGTGYVIPAGTSETFKILLSFATVSNTNGAHTDSMSTTLGAAASLSWKDTAGNGSAVTSDNTTYFYNYPVNSVSVTS